MACAGSAGSTCRLALPAEQHARGPAQKADAIAQQKRNRETLAALKLQGVSEAKLWLQRPGSVYLRLPAEQCARLIVKGERGGLGLGRPRGACRRLPQMPAVAYDSAPATIHGATVVSP